MLGLATSLISKGIPIHGLGFQAHIDEETLSDSDAMDELLGGELLRQFDRIASFGLLVRISEASVAENGNAEMQSRVYETLMTAAMRARNCVGFNLWGATNSEYRYSYFTGSGFERDPGDDAPTTQDANGYIHERPAMNGLRRAIAAR